MSRIRSANAPFLRLQKQFCAALVLLLLAIVPQKTEAHPHAWADMSVTARVLDGDTMSGVQITWLFDPLYSAYSISAFNASPSGLEDLARDTINNLVPYHYFATFERNEDPIQLGRVEEFTSVLNEGRWRFSFFLPFVHPVSLTGSRITYRIYDPTYYVEILHKDAARPIASLVNANCLTTVIAPKPSPDVITLALALDRGQSADRPIGRDFSEEVVLLCD